MVSLFGVLANATTINGKLGDNIDWEPDEGGFNGWVGKLDRGEKSRDDLVFGFSKSQEFANIKAQYGL